ncbi:MAG: FAD-linked oxidase C-terminal domain-containing protein [Planctomycetota bacterium]
MSKRRSLPGKLERRLRRRLGQQRLLTDVESLAVYECDALTHFSAMPLAVTFPHSTEDCVAIMRACFDAQIPVTPRGAGTGLSGGAVPPSDGGVLIDTSMMRSILELNTVDRRARVQPGLVNARLSECVAENGLFYAPDPSSQSVCTLGGNVAENASGPHGLKYGSTRQHILGATIVLEDGEIIELSDEGDEYDLLSLVVGSEGTLGIVTEIEVRLTQKPASVMTLLGAFGSLAGACQAVSDVIAAGIEASAIEAMDHLTIEAVESSVHAAGYPRHADAVLLIELDGNPRDVSADAKAIAEVFEQHDLLSFERANDPEQRSRLWQGRKGAFGAMGRVAPNVYVMDAVVPRSRLQQAILEIGAICTRYDLRLANVFHAGEGNLHPNISYDARDPDEVDRVLKANAEIVRACLDLGGTLSGEHGVGLEKKEFMHLQFGAPVLESFASIRRAFGPRSLMNPGKLLPTPRACTEVKGPAKQVFTTFEDLV